jgi:hypothetical protein
MWVYVLWVKHRRKRIVRTGVIHHAPASRSSSQQGVMNHARTKKGFHEKGPSRAKMEIQMCTLVTDLVLHKI